jgi:hypothetical protein
MTTMDCSKGKDDGLLGLVETSYCTSSNSQRSSESGNEITLSAAVAVIFKMYHSNLIWSNGSPDYDYSGINDCKDISVNSVSTGTGQSATSAIVCSGNTQVD